MGDLTLVECQPGWRQPLNRGAVAAKRHGGEQEPETFD